MTNLNGGNVLNNDEVKFPPVLIDEKLEIAYIGILHINPKAIAMFNLNIKECQFTVPKMMDLYKLVLFREGQAYASEAAKAGFSFPKVRKYSRYKSFFIAYDKTFYLIIV